LSFERLPLAVPAATPRSAPAIWLELSGSALRDGVRTEDRCITDIGSGLTIGRAHQPELHVAAIKDSMLQWVSREHFRVEPADGAYRLTPLSVNPMWLVRGGQVKEVLRERGPVELRPRDALLLFTGAAGEQPAGPGASGTLQWTCRTAAGAVAAFEPAVLSEATSPVAASPAVAAVTL